MRARKRAKKYQFHLARVTTDKDLRRLLRALERSGLQIIRGSKHLKIRDPQTGKQVVVPSTPSDRRGHLNMQRQLERSLGVDRRTMTQK